MKILASLMLMLSANVLAAEPAAPCAGVVDVKSKSRLYFTGKTLMTNLLMLEAQGEAKFHPTFAPPGSQCVFESFDVAGTPVAALYSPHEKGEATLHWQFATAGAEPRTIHVIYDGMSSLMAKQDIFYVIEERQGKISYYAMFRDQPTYAALKPLVSGILGGTENPLAVVQWPAGAKEPEIEAYDTKRLK